ELNKKKKKNDQATTGANHPLCRRRPRDGRRRKFTIMDRQHSNQFRGIWILQLNCGKSANIKHGCLEKATTIANIVLLQDPRIGPWSDERGGFTIISHPSFTSLLPPGHNNNTIKPRVATFISKTFPHLQVNIRPDNFNDPYLQVLEVSAPGVALFLL